MAGNLVKNKEYLKYLESIKKDSVKQVYDAALPDPGKAPFEGYFTNKKYFDYPIVGISLRQAINYCKWLTRIENKRLDGKGMPHVSDYRIPEEIE